MGARMVDVGSGDTVMPEGAAEGTVTELGCVYDEVGIFVTDEVALSTDARFEVSTDAKLEGV